VCRVVCGSHWAVVGFHFDIHVFVPFVDVENGIRSAVAGFEDAWAPGIKRSHEFAEIKNPGKPGADWFGSRLLETCVNRQRVAHFHRTSTHFGGGHFREHADYAKSLFVK
jgi:hypothetical protein